MTRTRIAFSRLRCRGESFASALLDGVIQMVASAFPLLTKASTAGNVELNTVDLRKIYQLKILKMLD